MVIHNLRTGGMSAAVTAATSTAATTGHHVTEHHAGQQIAAAVMLTHNRRRLNVNRRGRGGLYNRRSDLRDLLAGRNGTDLLQLRHGLRQLRNLLLLRLDHVFFLVAAGQGKSAQHGQRDKDRTLFHVLISVDIGQGDGVATLPVRCASSARIFSSWSFALSMAVSSGSIHITAWQ